MGRTTCCLCIPIHPASIVISVLGVVAGGVFGVVYAMNISNGVVFAQGNDKMMNAIPFVGMAAWMLLALISLFGVLACWTARPKLVAIYFWALLAQYILDLGFLVASILVAINSAKQQRQTCVDSANNAGLTNGEKLCGTGLAFAAIIFIAILSTYKLLATYTTYVIYKYRRFTVREALQNQAKAAAKQQQDMAYSQQAYNPNGEPRTWSKFED